MVIGRDVLGVGRQRLLKSSDCFGKLPEIEIFQTDGVMGERIVRRRGYKLLQLFQSRH